MVGNCQISSTLYNALLTVPSLVVTERDAAVAYGSYDLKFRNDSGNKIKIRAEATSDLVTVTLLSVK